MSSSFSFYTTAPERSTSPTESQWWARSGFSFSQLVLCVCVCRRERVSRQVPPGKNRVVEWGGKKEKNETTTTTRIVTQTTPKVQKNKWRRCRNEKLNREKKKKREWKLRLQPPPSRRGEEGKLPWKKKGELNYTFFCFVHFWWNGHTHTRPRDGKPTKWRDQHSPFCKILIWKEFFVSLLEIAGQR